MRVGAVQPRPFAVPIDIWAAVLWTTTTLSLPPQSVALARHRLGASLLRRRAAACCRVHCFPRVVVWATQSTSCSLRLPTSPACCPPSAPLPVPPPPTTQGMCFASDRLWGAAERARQNSCLATSGERCDGRPKMGEWTARHCSERARPRLTLRLRRHSTRPTMGERRPG